MRVRSALVASVLLQVTALLALVSLPLRGEANSGASSDARYCGRFLIDGGDVGSWWFEVSESGDVAGTATIEMDDRETLALTLTGSHGGSPRESFVVEMRAEQGSVWGSINAALVDRREWRTSWGLVGEDVYLDGMTEAVRCGGEELVEVPEELIEEMGRAAFFGDEARVRELLETHPELVHGAPGHELPLFVAASAGSLEVFRLLIEKGTDINAQGLNGGTVLDAAVYGDQLEVLDYLLGQGADPERGEDLLFAATSRRMVEHLVELGLGDPNRRNEEGDFPLHSAIRTYRRGDVLEALLENGADVEAIGLFGQRPVHVAADHGPSRLAVLQLLRQFGADLQSRTERAERTTGSQTALHLAAGDDEVEVVSFLLGEGLDPCIRDNEGKTPLDWARAADAEDAIAELSTVGGCGAGTASLHDFDPKAGSSGRPLSPRPTENPGAMTVDDLQKALKGRWEGAWVLAKSEVVSNCDGAYTNNSAQGGRVTGEGAARFPSGELGRVHRVDVHRSRIDVLIDLEEALLVPRQDGPFTLYEEVPCRIELELEVFREVVKERRLDLAEAALGEVLQAFPTVEEARASSGWNGRERGAYPADYETTLAEYQAWRMERQDQGVEARLEEALDRAARYFGFLLRDPENGETFATGARSVAGRLPDDCASLLTIDEGSLPTIAGSPRARDAYVAGQRMAFYLELARRLRGCLSKGS